jgi:hypothetical protein
MAAVWVTVLRAFLVDVVVDASDLRFVEDIMYSMCDNRGCLE